MGAVTEGTWEAEVSRMPCEGRYGFRWYQAGRYEARRGLPARVQLAPQEQEPLAVVPVLLLRLPMPATCCLERTSLHPFQPALLTDSPGIKTLDAQSSLIGNMLTVFLRLLKDRPLMIDISRVLPMQCKVAREK